MELGTWAQWVGAGVTASGIIVALFRDSIYEKFHHPDLQVRLAAVHPCCVKTPFSNSIRYFVRLWVVNKGDVRADKVEVFVTQAYAVDESEEESIIPAFSPANLRWSYSDWNDPKVVVDGISPDVGRYCDLLAIADPAILDLNPRPEDMGKVKMDLQTEVRMAPSDFFRQGRYRFWISVVASNRRPVRYVIDFHLTGIWSKDEKEMFSHGFTISYKKSTRQMIY